jgi:hypothetical protein
MPRRKNPFYNKESNELIPYINEMSVYLVSTNIQNADLVKYGNLGYLSPTADVLTGRQQFDIDPRTRPDDIYREDYVISKRFVFDSQKFKSSDLIYKANKKTKISVPLDKIIIELNKLKANTQLQIENLLASSDTSEFKGNPYEVLDESLIKFLYALQKGDRKYSNDLAKLQSDKALLSRIKKIYAGITNRIYRSTLAKLKKSELLSETSKETETRRLTSIYKADQILKMWFSQRLPSNEQLAVISSQYPDLQIPSSRNEYLLRMLLGYSVPILSRDSKGGLRETGLRHLTYAGKNRDEYQQIIPGKTYVPNTLFDLYNASKSGKPYEQWLEDNWIPQIKKWDFKPQFAKTGGSDILDVYESTGQVAKALTTELDVDAMFGGSPFEAFNDISDLIRTQCAKIASQAWFSTLNVINNETYKNDDEKCFHFNDFLVAYEMYKKEKEQGFTGTFEDYDKTVLQERFSEALTPRYQYQHEISPLPDMEAPTDPAKEFEFDQDPLLTAKLEQVELRRKVTQRRLDVATQFYKQVLRLGKYEESLIQLTKQKPSEACARAIDRLRNDQDVAKKVLLSSFRYLRDYAEYRIDDRFVKAAYLGAISRLEIDTDYYETDQILRLIANRIVKPFREELRKLDASEKELRKIPKVVTWEDAKSRLPPAMVYFLEGDDTVPQGDPLRMKPRPKLLKVGDYVAANIDGEPMGVRIVEVLDDGSEDLYYGVMLQKRLRKGNSDFYAFVSEVDYVSIDDLIEKLSADTVLGYPNVIAAHQKASLDLVLKAKPKRQNPYRSLDFMLIYSSVMGSLLNVLYANIWSSPKFAKVMKALEGETFDRDVELQNHIAQLTRKRASASEIDTNDAIFYWFALGQKEMSNRLEGKIFGFKKTAAEERVLNIDYITKQKVFRKPSEVMFSQFQAWVEKFYTLDLGSLQTYLFGISYIDSQKVPESGLVTFSNTLKDAPQPKDIRSITQLPFVTWDGRLSNTQFPKIKGQNVPYARYLTRELYRPRVQGTEIVPVSSGAYAVTLPDVQDVGQPILRKITPYGKYSKPLSADQYRVVMKQGTAEAKALASRQLREQDYYYALPIFYVSPSLYSTLVQKYLGKSSTALSYGQKVGRRRADYDRNCIFPLAFVAQDALTKYLSKNIKDMSLILFGSF